MNDELPPATPPIAAARAAWWRGHGPRARRSLRWLAPAVCLALAVVGLAGFLRFAAQVRALRERHASGPAWSFPSIVYSDALRLTPGRALPEGYLRAQLAARGYREAPGAGQPGEFAAAPGGMEIHLRGFDGVTDPEGQTAPQRVRLRLAGGRLAGLERLDVAPGGRPDSSGAPALEPVRIAILAEDDRVLRTWTPLARVPRHVRDAVVASEDRRFRRHWGLDLRGNLRALAANVQAGGVRQGGSTITQQLARGLFLGRERTWSRKLSEVFIALGLEILLSKDEILEMYLNSVYWGQSDAGGVAGIAEAARWYCDTPVESLTVAQAALLAGLIPAPNAYSPYRSPRLALERRNAVLGDMVATGALDAATAARLRGEPLTTRRGPPPPERFPGFTGYLRQYLGEKLPRGAAERWGLTVLTTLDLVWQPRAEEGEFWGLAGVEGWSGRGQEPLQGAFVALEPATGYVRVVVGARMQRAGEFNRATQARRQTGSAIKPIVYAAALDPGRGATRMTPATTVPDLRRKFMVGDTIWNPRNDKEEYHPTATLAKALAKSLNVATANLVEQIGADQVARYAERFGLGRLKPVASIGLGSNEATLLALTDAYATFPGRGERHEPSPVRAVVDGRGQSLLAGPGRAVRVLPASTADLMVGLLEDVILFGVAYPLRADYGFVRPAGGKTGTTNDYNDAWFVGFTPSLVAGAWVGYDTPHTLQRPAAEVAVPVWASIMSSLLEGFPTETFPGDAALELAWIDPWTGGLARRGCASMRVPFLPGTAPTRACTVFHPPADSLEMTGDSTGVAPPPEGASPPDSSR